MSSDELIFIDLGIIEYSVCHRLMLQLLEKRIEEKVGDTVLLLEHYDVYTIGRRGKDENIFDRSIPVYRVERGGDVTYHGPGQLVAYPIVNLNKLGLGVAEFVHIVEDTVIQMLRDFSISAARLEGKPGVWVGGRKIASIGMAVKNWVTYHGVAINVNTDLMKFHGIRPCGMEAEIMTSMASLLKKVINMDQVKRSFSRHLAEKLGKKTANEIKGTIEDISLF